MDELITQGQDMWRQVGYDISFATWFDSLKAEVARQSRRSTENMIGKHVIEYAPIDEPRHNGQVVDATQFTITLKTATGRFLTRKLFWRSLTPQRGTFVYSGYVPDRLALAHPASFLNAQFVFARKDLDLEQLLVEAKEALQSKGSPEEEFPAWVKMRFPYADLPPRDDQGDEIPLGKLLKNNYGTCRHLTGFLAALRGTLFFDTRFFGNNRHLFCAYYDDFDYKWTFYDPTVGLTKEFQTTKQFLTELAKLDSTKYRGAKEFHFRPYFGVEADRALRSQVVMSYETRMKKENSIK